MRRRHQLKLYVNISEDCIHILGKTAIEELTNKPTEVNPGVSAKGSTKKVVYLLDEPVLIYGVTVRATEPTDFKVQYKKATGALPKSKTVTMLIIIIVIVIILLMTRSSNVHRVTPMTALNQPRPSSMSQ